MRIIAVQPAMDMQRSLYEAKESLHPDSGKNDHLGQGHRKTRAARRFPAADRNLPHRRVRPERARHRRPGGARVESRLHRARIQPSRNARFRHRHPGHDSDKTRGQSAQEKASCPPPRIDVTPAQPANLFCISPSARRWIHPSVAHSAHVTSDAASAHREGVEHRTAPGIALHLLETLRLTNEAGPSAPSALALVRKRLTPAPTPHPPSASASPAFVPVIHDCRPDRQNPADPRRRRCETAGLVQIRHQPGVERVIPAPHPEADDVERHRGQQFQRRFRRHPVRQVAGNGAGRLHHCAKPVRAVAAQRHPDLQRPKPARQIRPQIAWPRVPPGQATRLPPQVIDGLRERIHLPRRVPHQDAAGVVGAPAPICGSRRRGCPPARYRSAEGAGVG